MTATLSPPVTAMPADGVAGAFGAFCAGPLAAAPVPGPETVYDGNHPLWKDFRAAGLANWWLPERFGGRGVGLRESVDLVAALAYHDPGFAFTAFLSILGSRMLELYGDPELSGRLLGGLATGGAFCGAMGSEHEAGSELTGTRTTFRREEGRLVLDGEKAFSTNLGFGRFGLVLARNEASERDFSVIVVPVGTPGFVIGHRWGMSGLHGTGTYAASFSGCAVPERNELRGNGIRILEAGLNASRILMASISIGIARRARDLSLEYAATKSLGGRPLAQNAVFAARLGQLEAELEALKSICWRAADDYDRLYDGPDPAGSLYRQGVVKSAVTAKMLCGQIGWGIVSTASEGFGGLGYTEDHPVQKLVRDMRHISIVECGDDVLRDLTYHRYVKRPSQRG